MKAQLIKHLSYEVTMYALYRIYRRILCQTGRLKILYIIIKIMKNIQKNCSHCKNKFIHGAI